LYMADDSSTETNPRLPASAQEQVAAEDDELAKGVQQAEKKDASGWGFTDTKDNAAKNGPAAAPSVAASAAAAISDTPSTAATPPSAQKNEPQKLADKSAAVPTEKKTVSTSSYRCMYSGWIVKNNPCSPQTKFPANYSIDGVDASKMVCPDKTTKKGTVIHQTMCNPSIFGLRLPKDCKRFEDCSNKAEPLCVSTGQWPTEDCYHKSTAKDTLVAADINTKVPNNYSEMLKAFSDLCDDKQIENNPFIEKKGNGKIRTDQEKQKLKNDIRVTCGWAETQLAQVKDLIKLDSDPAAQEKWVKENQKSRTEKGNAYKKDKQNLIDSVNGKSNQ